MILETSTCRSRHFANFSSLTVEWAQEIDADAHGGQEKYSRRRLVRQTLRRG